MTPSGSLADQLRDSGTAVGLAAESIVDLVQQVHDVLAARTYAAVGPVAEPVRVVQTGMARAVFGAVRAAHRQLPTAAGAAAAALIGPERPPVGERGVAAHVLAAAGGIYGDRLVATRPSLTTPTTLRHDGAVVDLTPAALRATFPDATGRLVVFVHGLCLTEHSWQLAGQPKRPDDVDYGRALRRDLAYTPLYVRYTSGRRVSDTGADVSALIDDLVSAWPVPVRSLALVGHSMGGLVVRSAAHQGHDDERPWGQLLTHVVALGSPHLGAPLEKGVHVAAWALGRFPESRPFGQLLDARSVGVKDLRFGSVVQRDWDGHDPDELLRDRCSDAPFLPHARYHYVASTAARSADGVWGRAIGDLMVRPPSASGLGRRRRLPFGTDDGVLLGGVGHMRLLRHPDVYELLRRWLSSPADNAEDD
jgi:triacylglycerol esterase/lipase EstA (alpha/beta hydrolase family)